MNNNQQATTVVQRNIDESDDEVNYAAVAQARRVPRRFRLIDNEDARVLLQKLADEDTRRDAAYNANQNYIAPVQQPSAFGNAMLDHVEKGNLDAVKDYAVGLSALPSAKRVGITHRILDRMHREVHRGSPAGVRECVDWILYEVSPIYLRQMLRKMVESAYDMADMDGEFRRYITTKGNKHTFETIPEGLMESAEDDLAEAKVQMKQLFELVCKHYYIDGGLFMKWSVVEELLDEYNANYLTHTTLQTLVKAMFQAMFANFIDDDTEAIDTEQDIRAASAREATVSHAPLGPGRQPLPDDVTDLIMRYSNWGNYDPNSENEQNEEENNLYVNVEAEGQANNNRANANAGPAAFAHAAAAVGRVHERNNNSATHEAAKRQRRNS